MNGKSWKYTMIVMGYMENQGGITYIMDINNGL